MILQRERCGCGQLEGASGQVQATCPNSFAYQRMTKAQHTFLLGYVAVFAHRSLCEAKLPRRDL